MLEGWDIFDKEFKIQCISFYYSFDGGRIIGDEEYIVDRYLLHDFSYLHEYQYRSPVIIRNAQKFRNYFSQKKKHKKLPSRFELMIFD